MLEITSGAVRAYYLFDIADTIDLVKMSALGGDTRAPAALPLRPHAPPYLQFPVPPLVASLPEVEFDGLRLLDAIKTLRLRRHLACALLSTLPARGTT